MPYRSKRSRSGKKQTFWISGAIKQPGALKAYIMNTFGPDGFTERGTIKQDILQSLAAGKCPTCAGTPKTCVCPTKITEQRARLAKKLRSFNK